jgi:energy-coupling factor transporter ATP-binding protein EcfA2
MDTTTNAALDDLIDDDFDEALSRIQDEAAEQAAYDASQASSWPKRMDAAWLLNFIRQHYDLRRSTDGMAFAVPKASDKPAIAVPLPLLGRAVRKVLFERSGSMVASEPLKIALETAEPFTDDLPPVELKLRASQEGECVKVDLGLPTGAYVEITMDGWQVVTPGGPVTPRLEGPRTLWRRSQASRPLPEPFRGGSRDSLREVLNLDPDDPRWKLIWGWLVAALFADTPRPILWFTGVQGSGKSTRARTVAQLVDPSSELGKEPSSNERDNLVAAAGRFLPSYDNIGKVSPATSDFLCRLVTGSEFLRRELYTDDGLKASSIKRTAIATSISMPYGLGPDALERLIVVESERMDDSTRVTESSLNEEFGRLYPSILGALYDDVARVLANLDTVKAAGHKLPRMADYAELLHALDQSLGQAGAADGFASAYADLVRDVMADRAFNDPLTMALLELVPDPGDEWVGTPESLFRKICGGRTTDDRDAWPTSAASLSMILRKQSEVLRAAGLEVARGKNKKVNGKSMRQTAIVNVSSPASPPPAAGDPGKAELYARALKEADGFNAHLVLLGDKTGCAVYDRNDGNFQICDGGALDMTLWDANSETYNGQLARPWTRISQGFRDA